MQLPLRHVITITSAKPTKISLDLLKKDGDMEWKLSQYAYHDSYIFPLYILAASVSLETYTWFGLDVFRSG